MYMNHSLYNSIDKIMEILQSQGRSRAAKEAAKRKLAESDDSILDMILETKKVRSHISLKYLSKLLNQRFPNRVFSIQNF